MTGYKDIGVDELEGRLRQGGLRLVDVRTDAEAARGMIPQGELSPLHLIPLRLQELDRGTPTVLGGRSAQATAFAVASGFADVNNLQGGIAAWARAGLALEA
ncbi:MAG: sulfurtransferase [Gallionellales bacterium GWA2_60_18]|nr:MAG: sulfurtransferase [Gallionellales bacterium GWA2_60_18]